MFSAEFSLKPSVDILLQTAEGRIICGIEKNISKDHCLIGRIIWHSVFLSRNPEILRQFVRLLCNSHVVLDQIYSYTPATTALMAMAYGLNTVSGGESDFYDYIGEHTLRPVINAPVELDELTETLDRTVSIV